MARSGCMIRVQTIIWSSFCVVRVVINDLSNCGVQLASQASIHLPYASSPGSIAVLQSPGGLSVLSSPRPDVNEWWEKMAKRIDDME